MDQRLLKSCDFPAPYAASARSPQPPRTMSEERVEKPLHYNQLLTDEAKAMLIELITKRTNLWSTHDPNFTNRVLRVGTWEFIAKKLKTDVLTARNTWMSLKMAFKRRLRRYVPPELWNERGIQGLDLSPACAEWVHFATLLPLLLPSYDVNKLKQISPKPSSTANVAVKQEMPIIPSCVQSQANTPPALWQLPPGPNIGSVNNNNNNNNNSNNNSNSKPAQLSSIQRIEFQRVPSPIQMLPLPQDADLPLIAPRQPQLIRPMAIYPPLGQNLLPPYSFSDYSIINDEFDVIARYWSRTLRAFSSKDNALDAARRMTTLMRSAAEEDRLPMPWTLPPPPAMIPPTAPIPANYFRPSTQPLMHYPFGNPL